MSVRVCVVTFTNRKRLWLYVGFGATGGDRRWLRPMFRAKEKPKSGYVGLGLFAVLHSHSGF